MTNMSKASTKAEAIDLMSSQKEVEEAPTIDRIVAFERTIVPHQTLTDAENAIRKLQRRYRPSGQPQLKARALLLVGESGSGKSTVLESYLENNQPNTPEESETEDGDIRPIVVVEVPQRPGRRQFVAAIMGALGYKAKDDWDTSEIIRRISYYCKELQVQILLIDEAHHIVEGRKQDAEEEISEFIKSLLNRCGVQIVLAGLPSLLDLRKYKQLNRRFQPPVHLRPYNWSTATGRVEFLAVLSLFEAQAALPKESNLADHEIAKRIYCATGGHIGLVSKYLSEALERALDNNRKLIDLKLLAQVHEAFEGEEQDEEGQDNEEQDELLMDFDALPRKMDLEAKQTRGNPFLATNQELKTLWKAMILGREKMVNAAPRRRPRETRFKGERTEPQVFS